MISVMYNTLLRCVVLCKMSCWFHLMPTGSIDGQSTRDSMLDSFVKGFTKGTEASIEQEVVSMDAEQTKRRRFYNNSFIIKTRL